jgi:hypothetical protein
MLTGALAAFAGFLTVRGAGMCNEAIYHSNQGVLLQAQASDTWAEYQADAVKARIVEVALTTATDAAVKEKLTADDKDLRDRQPALKVKALDFESQRDGQLKFGTHRLNEKNLLDYAGVAIQLAIALASVAALTRRRIAFDFALFLAAMGIAITLYALVFHYRPA